MTSVEGGKIKNTAFIRTFKEGQKDGCVNLACLRRVMWLETSCKSVASPSEFSKLHFEVVGCKNSLEDCSEGKGKDGTVSSNNIFV